MHFDIAGPVNVGRAFFGGKYVDTDRGFFNQINQPLHFMLFSSMIFTIALESLINFSWVQCFVNPRVKASYLQAQMDKAMEGLEFRYPLRLGTHLAYFNIIMLYSTALPTVFLLLPLYLTINYWFDKTMLLRMCKMPPLYAEALMDYAVYLLTFAIMLHLIAAIWILGTPAIFPSRVLVYQSVTKVNYFYVEQLSVLERLINSRTSVLLLLLIILLGLMIFVEPVALRSFRACFFRKPRRGQTGYKLNLKSYTIEKLQASNRLHEFSYDMKLSEQYRRALLLLDGDDIDEADDLVEAQKNKVGEA